jgi:uncharacterized protein (DUF433 family)
MRQERIETNPEIMDGKPVIRGTRIPVELILRKLGVGLSSDAILADHPRLTREHIRAAQAFVEM